MSWVRVRPGQAVLLLVAGLCLMVGPVVAWRMPGLIVDVWMWPSGVLAAATGAAIMARLVRCGLAGATPETAMATSVTIWGVAALLTGLGHAVHSPVLVAGAEIAQVMALPVVYLTLSVLPRGTRLLSVVTGVTLDAAALGMAAAVVAMPLLSPGTRDPDAVFVTVTTMPAVLVTVFGAALALLRRPPGNLCLLLWGLAIFGSAGTWLTTFRGASLSRTGLWPAEVLVVAGAAVTCAGLLALCRPAAGRPVAAPAVALRGEGRDLAVHAIVTTVALGLLIIAVTIDSVRGVPVPAPDLTLGSAVIVVLTVREILVTQVRRQLVRRVIDGSHTDPLTGLLNRGGMTDLLDADPQVDGSLVVLDIDRFSHANDQLGHSGADGLLIRVARAMQGLALPAGSVVARTGGDEFAVWLPGVGEPRPLARRLMAAASGATSSSVADMSPLTASAGVAMTGQVGSGDSASVGGVARADLLLQRANAALIEAKGEGRGVMAVFDAVLADAYRRRQLIERRLAMILETPIGGDRPGADGGGLTIELQPVVDLVTGRVSGAEALARWQDPDLGSVTPGEFIPIAEQTGLIVALGHRVLRLTVDAIAVLADTRPDLAIAVNVSAAQLRARPGGVGFTEVVRQCLAQAGLSPDRLIVEVTESLLISEDDPAVAELRCLMDMGIRVAVDDFGTGYWSLAYLQWLPANILKIDRSLVMQLGDTRRSEAVVRAIIDLARNLGMAVVVEGVETAEIARRAAELGAGLAQGWHFARSVPLAELMPTIERIETIDWSEPPSPRAATPLQRQLPQQLPLPRPGPVTAPPGGGAPATAATGGT